MRDKERMVEMELKVKKMRDNAVIPTRGSKEAAGIDLYACLDEAIGIEPGQTVTFSTGIACEFPKGYFGMVCVRSSIGFKRELGLINQIGIIDEDYRNEIKVGLHNYGCNTQIIEPNERIAQMILLPYALYNIVETDSLSETERGEGGIGSTGRF